jgi:NAD(P) transhydrogenase
MRYQQIVLGSGRDAVARALAAAGQGQLVALVNPRSASPVDMTILRQAVDCIIENGTTSMDCLRAEVARLTEASQAADRLALNNAAVDVLEGDVEFADAHSIAVRKDGITDLLVADTIVLACGTAGTSTFAGDSVLNSEEWLTLDKLPPSMIVVGAGRTGLEHAILLAKLGVEVTVVDEHSSVFDLCGGLMDLNLFEAQSLGIAFRLNDEVIGVESRSNGRAAVRLGSGRAMVADSVLVCVGRHGRTEGMNLESIGVGLDEQGRAWCDANGRTWIPSIVAIGDVVGFRTSAVLAG